MIKPQSSIVIALGVLFAAATIGYSFFQRFEKDAVKQAIPRTASFVYKAGSLEELLQSPVCSQINKSLSPELSLEKLLTENEWIGLAAPSEIAVADIPMRNSSYRKTWAAASWVGWRSPWLRWKLESAEGKKLERLGKHSVWPVWRVNLDGAASSSTLTVALTDNIFLACLSENPLDILILLDTYDKRLPSHRQGEQK